MPSSYPDLSGKRILMVSQDASAVKWTEVTMRRAGVSMHAVASIAEALALVEGVPGEPAD